MSELGRDVLGSWGERPVEKMEYIHKAIQEFIDAKRLTDFAKRIQKKFGSEVFRRSTIPLEFGDVAIQRYMQRPPKIKIALEIGTWNGIPAARMAQFCSKVITIDIEDRPEKYDIWKYMNVHDRIEFHLVSNETEKEELIKTLDFDFCYMDGAHALYTYSDWMMVRKCGRVLFHEYWEKQPPVWDLVNSLPENEVEPFILRTIGRKSKTKPFALWQRGGIRK